MNSKVLHALLALLVAVPFGAGGLCCCLFAESRPVAAAPVPSCCGDETAPVQRSSCPERDEGDCGCPARETALFAKPALDAGALPVVSVALLPALTGTAAAQIGDAHSAAGVPRDLHPPPKVPIYRTLCVILC